WRNDDYSGFDNYSEWSIIQSGPTTTPKFPARTKIAAVSRREGQLDIFGVAEDGKVYKAWWTPVKGWSQWRDISNGVIFGNPGSHQAVPMTVNSRAPGQLDIFVNSNGNIFTAYWTEGPTGTDWTSVTTG